MSAKQVPWRQVRHHWQIYILVLPSLILVGVFQYYPAASGIFHSFFRWNGADVSEYVGLGNYRDLLGSPAFWSSFKVALLLGGWNIVKMIPPLLVAVCIHRCRSESMQFLYRALFVIPMVVPGLVIVLIWRSFFFDAGSGFLNSFLEATHLMSLLQWMDAMFGWGGVFVPGEKPAWLGDPRLLLVACVVWGFPWVGSFAVLTYLAKLQGISKDIYEAAEVDGIGWFSKFLRIELPLISGSIYLLLVFVVIDTIKDAGMVLALAGVEGGPGGVVTVPALFILRKAFLDQQMGYACAIGVVLTLTVMAMQKIGVLAGAWNSLRAASRSWIKAVAAALVLTLVTTGIGTPWLLVFGLCFVPYSPLLKRLEDLRSESPTRLRRSRNSGLESEQTQWKRVLKERWLRFCKHFFIWLVLLSALLPLFLMVVVSFKTNQQFYASPAAVTPPLHWENWGSAWKLVTPAVANSAVVSITSTLLTLLFALGGAYFFARARMPLSSFLWNAILLLMMMPAIANLVPLFTLLRDLSLLNTLSALIIVGTSSGQVFAIFVLRSFIQDIPQDLFEAAEIDGASHFRQMAMIVLPLSGPILGMIGVMRFIAEWNDFVLPLIVIRDAERLPVMVQLLRISGEYVKHWGPLMAGYAIASLPIIVLFLFSMKLFIKGLTEGATKG